MTNKFVSLHNHTSYSLMDSVIKPNDLFAKASELGQPAIAVTDHATLAGAWDCWKASKKSGVKLLMGCEFNFVDDINHPEHIRHVILIAKNHVGYKNLLKAHKIANDHFILANKKVVPRIDWRILEECSEGLICTTACSGGILGQLINSRRVKKAEQQAKKLKEIFSDSLAFEIQPHAMVRNATPYNSFEDQRLVNNVLVQLGKKLDVKIVPTTDAHYLTPDQWEMHDALLAIGQGTPARARARLKYNVNDFYVKSYDEVMRFLTRYYPEQAEEFCENTLYFADMCEKPKWIDPKFSNSSGVELPVFLVKDQPDYYKFRDWLSQQSSEIQKKPEDLNYLRYLCFNNLAKINKDKDQTYISRVEKELDTFEFRNLASYMLIVADYVNWSKKEKLPTGPGRGCLAGNTQVLTDSGFKKLSLITKKDKVYTHRGQLRSVVDSFKYKNKENLLSIKTPFSFGEISLTSDHLVYGLKHENEIINKKSKAGNSMVYTRKKTPTGKPTWLPARSLEKGDFLYFTFPSRKNVHIPKDIDLLKIGNKKEDLHYKNHYRNKLSCREMSRSIKASYSFINNLKKKTIKKDENNLKLIDEVEKYLSNWGVSLCKWQNHNNYEEFEIKRFIKYDKDFCYLLGRWIGDGCYHGKDRGITISFHKEDTAGIEKVSKILKKLGCNPSINPSSKTMGLNLTVSVPPIFRLFNFLFPSYTGSNTKCLPVGFRTWKKELLESLLLGLIESDGHTKNHAHKIKSTSPKLILEIKELLSYLRTPAAISIEKNIVRNGVPVSDCYSIRFYYFDDDNCSAIKDEAGYYLPILGIRKNIEDYVYDISVDKDHSYLTTNYVVHNSVGGSLVAYLLGIHEADSIKYNLIFERFYNKKKKGMSDIDCDFGQSAKPLIEKYIIEKYGQEYVANVSNVNTITPKVYAKDVARVFEYGGNRSAAAEIGQNIADAIPADMKTVEEALDKAPLFAEYASQSKYSHLSDLKELSGLPRAMSTHAGGIIIGKRPLHHIVPVRRDKEGKYSVEYEKERAEENGLVKMDVLGVSTLDIIENTLKLIKLMGKELPQLPWDYDLNDKKTYELIGQGNTNGVFQLGTSTSTIDLCVKMQPQNIEDLAMINSMLRPGFPKEIRDEFIHCKKTGQIQNVVHPILEKSLSPTFGFALFDEVLLNLANDVAGWDLAEADRLRKFVKEKGKYPAKDKKLKEDFIRGTIENRGLSEKDAHLIWDEVISNFGAYIFNKSHAVTYSFLTYQTAYLKAHYPLEFLVANLMFEVESLARDSEQNINKIKNEIRGLGINILPPDINKSEKTYKILDGKTLLTGLNSLKFMGKNAIPEILAKRPFQSLDDFFARTDASKINISSVYALIAAGCFDKFGYTRKQMCLYADDYRKKLKTWISRRPDEEFQYPWPEDIGEWPLPAKYAQEVFYLGEGLCCELPQAYPGFFNNWALDFSKIPEIWPESNEKYFIPASVGVVQAVIKTVNVFKVKKETSKIFGQDIMKLELEDPYGNHITMTLFPSGIDHLNDRLRSLTRGKVEIEPGVAIHCAASINWYDGEPSLIFEDLRQVAPIPPRPKSLTPKKVSMKITKKKQIKTKVKKIDPISFLKEVEDELIEEGHADIEYD